MSVLHTSALPAPAAPHSLLEDVIAIAVGSLVVSFGIIMLRQAGALTGGTAGIAFLLHYATGLSFGAAFFALNLPFYWLAVRRMGWAFTIKTFCAVGLVSVLSDVHPHFVHFDLLNPFYATLFGNMLMGLGFIVLFRHHASLGGLNILALYLQARRGIRAGRFQMAVDFTILAASLWVVSLPMLAASVVGSFVLNQIIAMNHRPLRYQA